MKRPLLLILAAAALFSSCADDPRPIKVPVQLNEYVNIFRPATATFQGPDTYHFKTGDIYEDWLTNDHSIVKGNDGYWHIFGLLFPYPQEMKIHEGGSQSFHAVSPTTDFKSSLKKWGYETKPQVLTRQQTNHSPSIMERDGKFYMIYGNSTTVLATSEDLYNWEFEGEIFNDDEFEGHRDPRDPHILQVGDTYYISYCVERGVALRSSKDLRNWSEAKVIFSHPEFDPESPSIIPYDGRYYLFICVWNKHHMYLEDVDDAFPQITNVYVSDSVDGPYELESLVTTLNGHAPEIFQDEDGDWYISSAQYPYRGVNVDKLYWK